MTVRVRLNSDIYRYNNDFIFVGSVKESPVLEKGKTYDLPIEEFFKLYRHLSAVVTYLPVDYNRL